MKQDYPLKGTVETVTIQLEAHVVQIIKAMEQETKHSFSEITNTAVKRYISSHKDFLPPGYKKPKNDAL
ncbi:MAG: hypothetical protein EOP09_05545 [Proteobacteria bacterium]|nr:MAG: hypothetical protein EOP09_05545 [Pseudomonadota bacterium]